MAPEANPGSTELFHLVFLTQPTVSEYFDMKVPILCLFLLVEVECLQHLFNKSVICKSVTQRIIH